MRASEDDSEALFFCVGGISNIISPDVPEMMERLDMQENLDVLDNLVFLEIIEFLY